MAKTKIERQVIKPEDDILEYVSDMRRAVEDNYRLFGASEEYETGLMQLSRDMVVVSVWGSGEYKSASYSINDEGIVTFSDIAEVEQQFVKV